MAKTIPKKHSAKAKARDGSSYILILLTLMLVVSCASGFWAYSFGKRALKGVNPVPLGTKMPKFNPTEQPKKLTPTSFGYENFINSRIVATILQF